jgi:hypothetical protein
MIAVPDALFWAAVAWIAASGLLLGAVAVFAAPALVTSRRPARYFDDWNGALRAPWFFWHVGGLLFRLQELLGNYVLPAPQRACDIAASFLRAQVGRRGRGASPSHQTRAQGGGAAAAVPQAPPPNLPPGRATYSNPRSGFASLPRLHPT